MPYYHFADYTMPNDIRASALLSRDAENAVITPDIKTITLSLMCLALPSSHFLDYQIKWLHYLVALKNFAEVIVFLILCNYSFATFS